MLLVTLFSPPPIDTKVLICLVGVFTFLQQSFVGALLSAVKGGQLLQPQKLCSHLKKQPKINHMKPFDQLF